MSEFVQENGTRIARGDPLPEAMEAVLAGGDRWKTRFTPADGPARSGRGWPMIGYTSSMPLFDNRPEQPAPAVPLNSTVDEADVPRLSAHHLLILERLAQWPATNLEFGMICQRFGARLHEPKLAGHPWLKRTGSGSGFPPSFKPAFPESRIPVWVGCAGCSSRPARSTT
jgi:hypothetical protein